MNGKVNPILAFFVSLFGLVLQFVACNFLTFPVLWTCSAALCAYVMIFGPEIPILQYLSDVLPIDLTGSISMDETDVMRIYSLITMGLMVLSLMGKGLLWGLQQLIKRKPRSETKESRPVRSAVITGVRRLVISSVVITAINLTLFIALPFASLSEGASLLGMYFVAILFYVVAMLLNAIYTAIDSCSDYMLSWAISNITWWFTWRPGLN